MVAGRRRDGWGRRAGCGLLSLALGACTVAGGERPATVQAPAARPDGLRTPAPGPAEPIGTYANGCVRGALALPADGPGFQVLNLSRHRNWGHPDLIAYLTRLGARVEAEGMGRLAIGDMSMPRGGRMATGHASHQSGLDADIWFALDLPLLPVPQREREDLASMVDAARQRVNPARFGPAQRRLLELAAADEQVTRIFVNPAIKLAACEQTTGDRAWLRKLRPWFGHAAHLHVRLACPGDAGQCERQEPPPPGDGCGEELASWFLPPPPSTGPTVPPKPPPPPPAACLALFTP